jgi:hypothetical protein
MLYALKDFSLIWYKVKQDNRQIMTSLNPKIEQKQRQTAVNAPVRDNVPDGNFYRLCCSLAQSKTCIILVCEGWRGTLSCMSY